MVNLKNVTKLFGSKTVVDNVSLEIRQGELFGLLGPNGAGKTTTINMIIGGLAPDSGSIEINGEPPANQSIKRLLGIVPQTVALYESLSAQQNLNFFGQLYGLTGKDLNDRIQHAFEIVNLAERRNERVSKYSGGMKRRLNIAAALLHRPSLLILDEPTAALDPEMRERFYSLIADINRERGVTVLLVTHDTGVIGRHASKMLYLDKKLLFYGSFDDFCHSTDMSALFGEKSQHLICHRH